MKKRIISAPLSILLAIVMIVTLIPAASFADSTNSRDYYSSNGTVFIKSIGLAYNSTEAKAKKNITDAGLTLIDKNMNEGNDGKSVYLGYTTTTNPNEAIRGLRTSVRSETAVIPSVKSGDVDWYPVNSESHAWVPDCTGDGTVDLNYQGGGMTIILYITKDPNFGPPVTVIDFDSSTSKKDWNTITSFDEITTAADLNSGTIGAAFYGHWQSATEVQTSELKAAYTAAAPYVSSSSKYTSDSYSSLITAYNSAKSIVDDFNNHLNVSTVNDQSKIDTAKQNLNSAMEDLKIQVSFDGNGGTTSESEKEYTIGKNSSIAVGGDITAVRTGYTFLGWTSTSTGGTPTGSIDVSNTGTTLYAQWEHSHNFIYSVSGNAIMATCDAPGCPLTGSAPTLSLTANDVNYNGNTYSGASVTPDANWSETKKPANNITYFTDAQCKNQTNAANGAGVNGSAPREIGTYYAAVEIEGAKVVVEFSIDYITTDSVIAVSGNKKIAGGDWYTDTVTLTAPSGYTFSHDKADWKTTDTISTNGDMLKAYYLKNAEGYITGMKSLTLKIDTASPTAEIKIKNNSFTEFLNDITFGLFFKDTVDVTIEGADETSGVKTIEYQKVAKGQTFDPNGQWTVGDSFNVNASEEFAVYARITDNAGNTTTINSEGFIVYSVEDSEFVDKTQLGDAEFEVRKEERVPEIAVANSDVEMILMALTEDELSSLAGDVEARVWLEVKDAADTITPEAKEAIEAATKGYKIGQFLDISLFKTVGNQDAATQIHETTMKVKIVVTIPDELLTTDRYTTRTYYIVRNHNGQVEILDTVFDKANKTITFETDRFSDYAIAYKDVVKKPEVAQDNQNNQGGKDANNGKDTPNTGDTNNLNLWIILLCGFGAVLTGSKQYDRKRKIEK